MQRRDVQGVEGPDGDVLSDFRGESKGRGSVMPPMFHHKQATATTITTFDVVWTTVGESRPESLVEKAERQIGWPCCFELGMIWQQWQNDAPATETLDNHASVAEDSQ
jgi:hypothetical protein